MISIDFMSRKSVRWVLAAIALASTVAYCAPPGTFRKIDFDMTGTVRDSETKALIEGAYVVAIYYGSASSPAASATFCTKTLGMLTGKDGTFRFPVEKLNNLRPGDVMAIKPGYFGDKRIIPTSKIQRAQTAETYTGRDVILTKQNPEKPEFLFGESEIRCERARWRDDAAASIEFLKIKIAELNRLRAEPWRARNVSETIAELQQLPSKPTKQ